MLKAWGAYGKAYYQWVSKDQMPQTAMGAVIKTTKEQDRKFIDFITKGESHLAYIYCVNRAREVLTAGGVEGLGASITASDLLRALSVQKDAVVYGVYDTMFQQTWAYQSGFPDYP